MVTPDNPRLSRNRGWETPHLRYFLCRKYLRVSWIIDFPAVAKIIGIRHQSGTRICKIISRFIVVKATKSTKFFQIFFGDLDVNVVG